MSADEIFIVVLIGLFVGAVVTLEMKSRRGNAEQSNASDDGS